MAHDHDHSVRADAEVRPLAIALALIVAFMAVEVVVGILADSLALLSDAAHMLIDAAALALSVWAARLARRPAERPHDVRVPAGRDPVGAGERDHAARARRADRRRGGAAAHVAARR